MQYQLERLENLAQSQTLLAELFTYVGEHYDPEAQLRADWRHFFQLWSGQTPYTQIKVFTARNNGKLTACVMALVIDNPLFVSKPFVSRFIDFTNGDKAFEEYVQQVLASL